MSNLTLNTWTDATQRKRGEENKPADSWEYQTEYLRIWISTGHIYNPGKWVITCHALGFDAVPMKCEVLSPEHAQLLALQIILEHLAKMISSLKISK